MQSTTLYKTVKIVGIVVMALMAVAIIYASGISLHYWSGIGV